MLSGLSFDEAIVKLVDEYDAPRSIIEKDVTELVSQLSQPGM